MPWPFNPDPDETAKLVHFGDTDETSFEFPPCNQYGLQVQRMNDAILNDLPVPTPLVDAVENMLVIDAMVASSKSNGWIDL